MSIIWRIFAAIAAVLAIVFGSVAFAWPSLADPSTQQTYTAVGSNTTQDLMAALSNQLITPPGTLTPPAGVLTKVGSYEATPLPPPAQTITPLCGVTFTRPNGSGAGVAAFSASINPDGDDTFDGSTITGCVQFARSSSGPSPAEDPGVGPLTYVPLARDGVGYVFKSGSGLTPDQATAVANLTTDELTQIYEGLPFNSANDPAGSDGAALIGVNFEPYLPQSGSGTRNFFQGVIGVPDGSLGTDVNASNSNEENTASVIGSLSVPADTVATYPFSASAYIAQDNGYSQNSGLSTVTLGFPDGVDPITSGSTLGQVAANSNFYNGTHWGRDVYDVFQTSEVTAFEPTSANPDPTDPLLSQFVVTSANPNPAILSAEAQTIITDYGFLTEPYDAEVGVSTAPTGPYSFTP